ncbi:UNVERIFIED_CONTAM: hypothetical protein ABIC26_003292 [Paenibacillus sp. PvR008]
MSNIRFLTVQEAIAINVAMIERYSKDEQIGVKNISLLESAILRPQMDSSLNHFLPKHTPLMSNLNPHSA